MRLGRRVGCGRGIWRWVVLVEERWVRVASSLCAEEVLSVRVAMDYIYERHSLN